MAPFISCDSKIQAHSNSLILWVKCDYIQIAGPLPAPVTAYITVSSRSWLQWPVAASQGSPSACLGVWLWIRVTSGCNGPMGDLLPVSMPGPSAQDKIQVKADDRQWAAALLLSFHWQKHCSAMDIAVLWILLHWPWAMTPLLVLFLYCCWKIRIMEYTVWHTAANTSSFCLILAQQRQLNHNFKSLWPNWFFWLYPVSGPPDECICTGTLLIAVFECDLW